MLETVIDPSHQETGTQQPGDAREGPQVLTGDPADGVDGTVADTTQSTLVTEAAETASGTPVEKRKPTTPEIRKRIFGTIVSTEAARAFRNSQDADGKPLKTEAQEKRNPLGSAMAQIGYILTDRILPAPSTGESFRDDRNPWFEPHQPLPRIYVQENGDFVPTFDKRTSTTSQDASALSQNVIELMAYRGVTQDGASRTVHFIGRRIDAQGREQRHPDVQIPIESIPEIFFLAQYHDIRAGFDQMNVEGKELSETSTLHNPSVCAVVEEALHNCEKYINGIDATHPQGSAPLDIIQGLDDEKLQDALEHNAVSARSVITFAQRMKEYVSQGSWGSERDRDNANKEIDIIIRNLETESLPIGHQLQRLISVAGAPELQKQESKLEAEISRLRTSNKDTTDLEEALKNLKSFRGGSTQNIYRTWLDAACSGQVDPKDAQWFNEQLSQVVDPTTLLGEHKIDDPNCLAGKAYKYLLDNSSEEKKKRIQNFISKFLHEKGTDIAMMAVFMLFQFVSGAASDALRKSGS